MRPPSGLTSRLAVALAAIMVLLAARGAVAQEVPTPDQLDQLLAPVALYPDTLVAQICAAATDPQQVLDANSWVQQNASLSGQARTDAAQQRGFDPAFIALVNFPQILDMMAQNIDAYAAIGRAFSANQATVTDSIQRLRQQAYAAGALQSNQYQNVDVQDQAVTIQPANPQVVYIPQYDPAVIYQPPDTGAIVASSLVSFGVGIALGAWITDNRYPWGWGGWGWNWGRRTVIVQNNVWVVHNYYRPPRPYYRYRPPAYSRPIYVRPPNNWHDRPYYRPPGGRPPGDGPSNGRPPPDYRPPGGGRPPGSGNPGGGRPPGTGKPGNGGPGGGNPGGGRPPGNGGGRPPRGNDGAPPPRPAVQPPRPMNPPPQTRPAPVTQPAPRPSVGITRPAPASGPAPRPSPYAGYPGAGNNSRPANTTGARPSAFGGGHDSSADRAASSRGRSSSSASQQRPQTSQQRPQNSGGQRR